MFEPAPDASVLGGNSIASSGILGYKDGSLAEEDSRAHEQLKKTGQAHEHELDNLYSSSSSET